MKLQYSLGLLLTSILLTSGCGDTTSSSTTTTNTTTATLGFNAVLSKSVTGGSGTDGNLVTAGDWDQDGRSDFAIANPANNSVSVFRSNGSDFDSEVQFSTAQTPVAIGTGDFNKDGKPDLVVVTKTVVSVLLNTGSGTFPTHVDLNSGTDNLSVATGDFDEDGFTDIAVGDNGANQLHVVFSDGTSNPAAYTAVDYNTSANTIHTPVQIVTGDFNQDGRLDLAIANGAAAYLTLWTNSAGTRANRFLSSATQNSALDLPTGYHATGLAAADYDGDGRPDLATAATDGTGAQLRVFLNKTTGLTINISGGVQSISPEPRSVVAGDFNGDGYLDAVVVSRVGVSSNGTGEADVLLGGGSGAFSSQNPYVVPTGKTPFAGAAGDFNADGKPDLVLTGASQAFIFLNSSTVE